MDAAEKKQQFRKELLSRRSAIPEAQYEQKSIQIINQLSALKNFKRAELIHCYVSINERREVNTHPLINKMLIDGKQVVVPVMKMQTGTMNHVKLEQFEDLKKNDWGVLEPQGGDSIPVKEFDLVIVPMVGGDLQKTEWVMAKDFMIVF